MGHKIRKFILLSVVDGMKTCFFIGHRDTGSNVVPLLEREVERHISEYSVTDFTVVHYGTFDAMAAKAVIRAKKRHPKVTLTLLLPYHPEERPIRIPDGFDGTLYPPDMERVPKRLAIVRANQYALRHCTHLIACVSHPSGGSWEILSAARKREARGLMHVINLADGNTIGEGAEHNLNRL